MGSCQVWSVYLTTHLLGRPSPFKQLISIVQIISADRKKKIFMGIFLLTVAIRSFLFEGAHVLSFTTLWANSADDKTIGDIFLTFPWNRIWHFIQIVFIGDNLHEMSNPVFFEKNIKKYFNMLSAENFTQSAKR